MKRNFWQQLSTTLLALLLIAYIVLQITLNVGDLVELETITYTTVQKKLSVNGYIFRDEQVLETGTGGYTSYLAAEGERVAAGGEVAFVYNNQADAATRSKLREIDEQIDILNQSAISKGSSTTNLELIDEGLSKLLLEVVRASDQRDLARAAEYRRQIMIELNRRQAIVESKNNYDEQIAALNTKKQGLEAQIGNQGNSISTPVSGYFYSNPDGYEASFTREALDELTIDSFRNLLQLEPDAASQRSVGKMVTDPRWNLVCEVDKRIASRYTVMKSYSVAFPYSANEILSMTLDKVVTQTDTNTALLVFSTRTRAPNFNYTRSQTVDIIEDTYNGLKLSVSALRIVDGKSGVYALDGNRVVFKTTSVLYEQNGYYICAIPKDPKYPERDNRTFSSNTELSLHDPVIRAGRDIYEGKLLK